ncbi:MAG: ABC transporter ATP-binding protein [Tissierellia bacterium]|nr:ABC transporter ATP-binding protein [Tissierellia bacterium]
MTSSEKILEVNDLVIRFGGLTAIDGVNMHINKGEFVGLIGPNGAGKTTFFNSITGNVTPSEGSISFNGESLLKKSPDVISHMGISRTFQNIRIFPKMTVLENVSLPMHSKPSYNFFSAMLGLPSVKKADKIIQEKAMDFLHRLGIAEYKDYEAGTLPYGLQRRLEIARALAADLSLLLLDEPAAGMNNDECNELVELLQGIHEDFDISIMLIEHHIDVVLNLCSRIYVLNLGQLLAEGPPHEIQSNPDVIRAYLGERREGR